MVIISEEGFNEYLRPVFRGRTRGFFHRCVFPPCVPRIVLMGGKFFSKEGEKEGSHRGFFTGWFKDFLSSEIFPGVGNFLPHRGGFFSEVVKILLSKGSFYGRLIFLPPLCWEFCGVLGGTHVVSTFFAPRENFWGCQKGGVVLYFCNNTPCGFFPGGGLSLRTTFWALCGGGFFGWCPQERRAARCFLL